MRATVTSNSPHVLADTYHFPDMEHCINWKDSVTLQVGSRRTKWSPQLLSHNDLRPFQIDFTLSVFFVVYFFVRFLAAEDKVLMLFSMESIIDFLTLPPVFLSGKRGAGRRTMNDAVR